jgi:hypothetical protein
MTCTRSRTCERKLAPQPGNLNRRPALIRIRPRGFYQHEPPLSQQRRHQQPTVTQRVCSSRRICAPNRLVAHITLDDSVALDVGKVCFAVGWRKG